MQFFTIYQIVSLNIKYIYIDITVSGYINKVGLVGNKNDTKVT